MGCFPMTKSI
ncbi:hypothetical protein FWK35_00002536 [Aphis craccivora]|uniref:Uncharacterized protein n=1 Tax=Aphis craccivora TaxID=307492 RepID=A0A6G0ZL07_APHCR|nr:hypothetical protein FWK35_00002536 [Aphis craccivora]